MLHGMWTLIWFSSKENNKYSLLAAERMSLLDSRFQKSCVFLLLQWKWKLAPWLKKNKPKKVGYPQNTWDMWFKPAGGSYTGWTTWERCECACCGSAIQKLAGITWRRTNTFREVPSASHTLLIRVYVCVRVACVCVDIVCLTWRKSQWTRCSIICKAS